MDPNTTDPNNPNHPAVGGQPDLSSSILATNPVDQTPLVPTDTFTQPTPVPNDSNPVAPSFNTAPTSPDQNWSTNNSSVWTPPSTVIPTPPTPSLDNPFNVPTQPPVIDGGIPSDPPRQSEIPTWQLPTTPPITLTQTVNEPAVVIPPTPAPEQAPTDLSHLIPDSPASSNEQQPVYTPPIITQPETLIVPPDGNEVGPNIPATEGNHSKIPKWVIGVGIGLLLAVAAATAYFIWPGFGNSTSTGNLNQNPGTEQSIQTPVVIPTSTIPTVTPTVPVAGGTAASGFGSVDGNSSPSATPPTSAADLLRQRQQQGR